MSEKIGSMTLAELSKRMQDIDFAMMLTHTEAGRIAGRPMSNNGDVEYRGDSFFFTWEHARTVGDIERDPKITLAYQANKSLLGKPGIMITVEGDAELIREKSELKAHWVPELDRWFEQGIDTPDVVMIKVHATRIHYWDGMEEGEVSLS